MREKHINNNGRVKAIVLLALVCGVMVEVAAQPAQKDKPKVDLVSVVGCASQGADGAWMLTNASEPRVVQTAAATQKDLDAARTQALGKNRFRLIGTAEFASSDELLKNPVRSQITAKGSENVTGQLKNGRKLAVKGLLINAANEKRLNLTSVQPLAESCK